MGARVLDGKALAHRIRGRIAEEVAQLRVEQRVLPGLAAVLVGEDPASKLYVDNKHRACEAAGIYSRQIKLPATVTHGELLAVIDELNLDDQVDGILVQLPLPLNVDPTVIQERIDPDKDVDALHPMTAGRLLAGQPTFIPCTPYGVLEILRDGQVELAGARVVVVGRSILVGRPLAVLLSLKGIDATVVQTHSRTRDLPGECRRADVLVAAAGVPSLITPPMVKPGAAVVGAGITWEGKRLVPDVDESVAEVAGWITPRLGGVGPMTRAMLLTNCVEAAERRAGRPG